MKIFAFLAASLPAYALAIGDFTTSISQVIQAHDNTDETSVLVNFVVSNPTSDDLDFDVANTPLEGLYGDVITVVDNSNGVLMDYHGKVARRSPYISSTITIPAGSEIAMVVDLVDGYDLQPYSTYTVEYDNEETVVVVGGLIKQPAASGFMSFGDNVTALGYTNCNSNEESQIKSAENTAASQASRAKNSLAGGVSSLYTTWFGAYTSSNFNKVKGDFDKINQYIRNSNYYCNPRGCSSNTYAYVYPSDRTQTIYLCGAFWSIPSERAETIVHEVSHFNTVASTDDYTYGRTSCKALARNNPGQAIRNADNQCFFGADA